MWTTIDSQFFVRWMIFFLPWIVLKFQFLAKINEQRALKIISLKQTFKVLTKVQKHLKAFWCTLFLLYLRPRHAAACLRLLTGRGNSGLLMEEARRGEKKPEMEMSFRNQIALLLVTDPFGSSQAAQFQLSTCCSNNNKKEECPDSLWVGGLCKTWRTHTVLYLSSVWSESHLFPRMAVLILIKDGICLFGVWDLDGRSKLL